MTLNWFSKCFHRKARAGRRVNGSRRRATRRPRVEPLEERCVPALSAAFDFTMPPRIVDSDGDHRFPIYNTYEWVNPPDGFNVNFDATPGDNPTTSIYGWSIRTTDGTLVKSLSGPTPSTKLQEGTYNVTLSVLNGGSTSTVSRNIVIDDLLIVVAGDSFASGEGNPEVNQIIEFPPLSLTFNVLAPEVWGRSGTAAMDVEHAEAHRTSLAGAAQAALQLEQEDLRTSVTLVNVAQSGATVSLGLLGNKEGYETPGYALSPQITELQQIIGQRHIDALVLSVGANDIGFDNIVSELVFNAVVEAPYFDAEHDPDLIELGAAVDQRIDHLDERYATLDDAIHSQLDVGPIYLLQYPDMTRDADGGSYPDGILDEIVLGLQVGAQELDWARTHVIVPLDHKMRTSAGELGWTYIDDISADFVGHGYGTGNPFDVADPERWVRTWREAHRFQGALFGAKGWAMNPPKGVLHPNELGHAAVAARILPHLETLLASPDAVITGPFSASAGETVTFSGLSSTARVPISLFEWDFDADIDTFFADASGDSINHTFPASDFFDTQIVKLRVTDGQGRTSQAMSFIDVFPTSRAFLNGRVLTVNGTVGADSIQVSLNTKTSTVTLNGATTSWSWTAFDGVLIHGFAGNDTISVTGLDPKPVTINGGPGNDNLTGGGANDRLNGDEGNDTLSGGLGNDTLLAGEGSDSLIGSDGDDSLNGGIGNDTLHGGIGNDTLLGVDGTDSLVGFDGNDSLNGGIGNDTVSGGEGNDAIYGSAGNDTLLGGNGADTIRGQSGDDFINSGPGGDDVNGGTGVNVIQEDADDIPPVTVGDEEVDTIDESKGAGGGILLRGTDGRDDIRIARRLDPDGAHVIITFNGRTFEHIYKGGKTIIVYAGKGDDRVVLDETAGVTWRAEFHGEGGNDTLIGAGKDDLLEGGRGRDVLFGRGGVDTLIGDEKDRLLQDDEPAASLAAAVLLPPRGSVSHIVDRPAPEPQPKLKAASDADSVFLSADMNAKDDSVFSSGKLRRGKRESAFRLAALLVPAADGFIGETEKE